jgi:hypothetical protein
MIGVGNGVGGGARHRGAYRRHADSHKWTCVWLCPSMAMRTRGVSGRRENRIMSESGFKCSVHVSSVSMTMYDDSKWKDTYNMISRPRL